MLKTPFLFVLIFILLLAGCTKTDRFKSNDASNQVIQTDDMRSAITVRKNGKVYTAVRYKAEYVTHAKSAKAGQTLFYKIVGNKRVGLDYVPADPRRGGRTNIMYAIDDETTTDNGLSFEQVEAAIDNAMETWDAVKCSDLNMTKVSYSGDLGWIQQFAGFGGGFDWVADIQHSGFLPGEFFESIQPGGSFSILAITYYFVWIDGDGNITDIDRNGMGDLAFTEIYYNDAFSWSTNSSTGIDIETVALHEAGHGLAQDHSGKAFVTNSNGKLHIAPRAVMNPVIWGEQRSLLGTDNGGHCSIWANWPKR